MADLLVYLGGGENEELRYAIRSWERNLKFDKLCAVGGPLPQWFEPDIYIPNPCRYPKMQQCWDNLCLALKDRRLSQHIVLMMDDIYLLKPFGEWKLNHNRGTLDEQVARIGTTGEYSRLVQKTNILLKKDFSAPLSFEEHAPFYCEKNRLHTVLSQYGSDYLYRSIYGNIYQIPTEKRMDIKLQDVKDRVPLGATIFSSSDKAFKGNAGSYMKFHFPKKSRFEK